ncbi:hypothetical protein I306_02727 [Cryptococcus gattii EJB2]|uniref:Uncharacterized protein n=1 Tax=Cryptococcus gattii EJB2 TaxID=1296103 RepID=A0ABR5BX50_9TREE|nr:hypothetical protein I306_02727 [Cryptococcus gattii EJB2]
MAPNGYYQDAEMNSTVGRPNWDHLKCHFYQNLVNAAVDVCLPDSSVSSMPSREEFCKRVKDYLEGTAKMKKRMKAEREANQLLKAICARVNPSLLLVYHMEASVHGLSTSHNLLDSQDDEGLTSDANQYAEFLVLCDLYEQERVDEPRWVVIEVWWWSDIRMAIWTAFEVYRLRSAHRPTKVFHLPWEYIDSSMGFRIQESASKGPQGNSANINALRWPEIHVTKGMVDKRLIGMLKSSNVPEPIDIPFDVTINNFCYDSSPTRSGLWR